MVRKELFDKCVGLLEESGLGENAACEVTWVFEDVAEGEDITPEQEKRISDIVTRRCEGYPCSISLDSGSFMVCLSRWARAY